MQNKTVKSIIIKSLKNNIYTCILLIIAIIGVVFISLVPAQILKIIIDENLVLKDYTNLLFWAIIYFSAVFSVGIFDFFKNVLLAVIGQGITKDVRAEMMNKLTKIDSMFFSSNNTGTVVSRFTNDVDAVNSLFSDGIIGMVIDLFKIIGILISIYLFNWVIGLFATIILPLIYLIIRFFQKRMLKSQIENRIIVGKVNNQISESIKSFETIKAFSKEDYMEGNFASQLKDNYETKEKINFYDSIFPPMIQIIRSISIVALVMISTSNLNFMGITIGMIAASIELLINLFAPVENLGMELQSIQQAISGIKRVNDFLSEPEEDNKQAFEDIGFLCHEVKIAFNHVTFGYDKDTVILQDFDLKVEENKTTTFVGRTGVGKTTTFKLILGLLKPNQGEITINGINVIDIPNSKKRQIFGYVNQSVNSINGTVADQISLGDKSITVQQIEDALEFVDLLSYVKSLEHGLQTEVQHDNIFSQGQKQLLAIARAIVTNPPILLFDEITSNLDSVTEEKFNNVLKKASGNRTILSISHRLTSIFSADKLVIIENGKIKNIGTPSELLQNDEWYKARVTMEKLSWNDDFKN